MTLLLLLGAMITHRRAADSGEEMAPVQDQSLYWLTINRCKVSCPRPWRAARAATSIRSRRGLDVAVV